MNIQESFNQECRIGKIIAKNRFLAQPVEHNQANKAGGFSEPMLEFYRRMAKGKWGFVVLETTATSLQERCRINGLVLSNSSENQESWKKFFKEMKKINNEWLSVVEISAAGFKNQSGPIKALYVGQSEMPNGEIMSTEEIDIILNDYVNATRLAYEHGADGIDFKLCHTYLAGLFLRPNNQRDDKYGGNFKNRTHFLSEYIRRAKQEIGDSKFLWTTRLNAWDGSIPGGFGMAGPVSEHNAKAWVRDNKEVLELYELLNDLKFDLVNISAGIGVPIGMVDPYKSIHPNFIFLQEEALKAKRYFENLGSNIVIASTGWSALGPKSLSIGSEYINRGIDFIGYGRQQLCDPLFPKCVLFDAPSDDTLDYIEENSNICIVCGKCYTGLNGEGPVICPIYSDKK